METSHLFISINWHHRKSMIWICLKRGLFWGYPQIFCLIISTIFDQQQIITKTPSNHGPITRLLGYLQDLPVDWWPLCPRVLAGRDPPGDSQLSLRRRNQTSVDAVGVIDSVWFMVSMKFPYAISWWSLMINAWMFGLMFGVILGLIVGLIGSLMVDRSWVYTTFDRWSLGRSIIDKLSYWW